VLAKHLCNGVLAAAALLPVFLYAAGLEAVRTCGAFGCQSHESLETTGAHRNLDEGGYMTSTSRRDDITMLLDETIIEVHSRFETAYVMPTDGEAPAHGAFIELEEWQHLMYLPHDSLMDLQITVNDIFSCGNVEVLNSAGYTVCGLGQQASPIPREFNFSISDVGQLRVQQVRTPHENTTAITRRRVHVSFRMPYSLCSSYVPKDGQVVYLYDTTWLRTGGLDPYPTALNVQLPGIAGSTYPRWISICDASSTTCETLQIAGLGPRESVRLDLSDVDLYDAPVVVWELYSATDPPTCSAGTESNEGEKDPIIVIILLVCGSLLIVGLAGIICLASPQTFKKKSPQNADFDIEKPKVSAPADIRISGNGALSNNLSMVVSSGGNSLDNTSGEAKASPRVSALLTPRHASEGHTVAVEGSSVEGAGTPRDGLSLSPRSMQRQGSRSSSKQTPHSVLQHQGSLQRQGSSDPALVQQFGSRGSAGLAALAVPQLSRELSRDSKGSSPRGAGGRTSLRSTTASATSMVIAGQSLADLSREGSDFNGVRIVL